MPGKSSQAKRDAAAAAFRERMQFLETMWNATTEYEVDLSTGRGWFKVRMPGSQVVLFVADVDVESVMLPGS